MKKILVIALALLMLVSTLAACGSSGNTEQTAVTTTTAQNSQNSPADATATQSAQTTASQTEMTTEAEPQLPALNFNNETVSILYWEDVSQPEFEVENLSGDLIKDALYNRNIHVEEQIGIKFEWIGTPGNYHNQAAYVTQISNDINSGGSYDIFAGYSMTAATIALKGFSRDLLQLQHIDFEQPWWPSSLTELATFKDRLYFCSGDISTNLIHSIYCIFFNKTLANELQLGNLYEVVESGKWTIDKMAECASIAYSDLNGNSAVDDTDRFGIMMATNQYFDFFFLGAGLRTTDKDADGNLIMDATFASDVPLAILEKAVNIFHANSYAVAPATLSTVKTSIFTEGRSLFLFDVFNTAASTDFTSADITYGVLPLAKADENQESYATATGFPYTMYSISNAISVEDADRAAATLEYMAAESYKNITPAVFEITMKLKYADNEIDSKMYDLIRSSVYMDLGRIFSTPLDNYPSTIFRQACIDGNTNWASRIKSEGKAFSILLKTLSRNLDSLAN